MSSVTVVIRLPMSCAATSLLSCSNLLLLFLFLSLILFVSWFGNDTVRRWLSQVDRWAIDGRYCHDLQAVLRQVWRVRRRNRIGSATSPRKSKSDLLESRVRDGRSRDPTESRDPSAPVSWHDGTFVLPVGHLFLPENLLCFYSSMSFLCFLNICIWRTIIRWMLLDSQLLRY